MEDVETICNSSKKAQPRIIAMVGEEGPQYFLSCECRVLCKASTLIFSIFLAFSCCFCFNLEYPLLAKNILYFFRIMLCVIQIPLRKQLLI